MTASEMTLTQIAAELEALRSLPTSRRCKAVKARCAELADEMDARSYDWGHDYL